MTVDSTTPDLPASKRWTWNRRLRIAVSVFFCLLTVALCVLWVRSYWRLDQVTRDDATMITVYSNNGVLGLTLYYTQPEYIRPPAKLWRLMSTYADGRYPTPFWKWTQNHFAMTASHLVLALVPAAIAISPWVQWKFSLRTLMIATTMVAVVLGLVVWAGR